MSESNVSFSFTKKTKRSLVKVEDDEKDFVTSVEDKQINSKNPKPAKDQKNYYVPLIKKVKWRMPAQSIGSCKDTDQKSEDEIALDKEAAAAIMKDLQQARDRIADDDDNVSKVPLLMQNQPPISDDSVKADVELRPEESSLDDYDNMPVTQFGIACLRGMGWKKSEGVGLSNKRCVEPTEFIQRSARQGLGATLKVEDTGKRRRLKPGEQAKKLSQPIQEKNGRVRWVKTLDEEVPQVIEGYSVGACVTIVSGPHAGLLGKIEKEDTSERFDIQLTLNKQVVQCSMDQLKLLTVDEFNQLKKQSRKKSRMQRYGLINMQTEDNEEDDVICVEHSPPALRTHTSSDHGTKRTVERDYKQKKKCRTEDRATSDYHSHKSGPPASSWLAPNLRVRIISKDYCKGAYYNNKVNIVDVTSLDCCMCKTDDGRFLDDLHQSCLETLIPKEKYANVMIVKGQHKHKVATVLERNRSAAIVTVQLEDSKEVLSFSYDDVCQCV